MPKTVSSLSFYVVHVIIKKKTIACFVSIKMLAFCSCTTVQAVDNSDGTS
uniref:Uncharacterized protein n=1 Tax=Anguilla anguilla TaxID=7936 RepID=A0A0E9U046_ANGAN